MIGKTISHYKILEKLGEGGMGIVYKAEDTKLKRTVALKFLPPHLSTSEQDKSRFIQEAQAASALNHPNVCTIHDIQEHDGQMFIVMEFVDGQTLREKKDAIGFKQAIDIGIQVADGLAVAHEKGIVHRDIKPENIMIRKDGIAQIMDFGLAKLRSSGSKITRLTKEGSTVGTAGYMSPEQVQGQETDHRSDIFSYGVLLFELLTGQLPFKGVHETAMAYEIVNVDAPPMSSIKSDIDPSLDAIVFECLEKDPRERAQSMAQISIDLKRYKRESSRQRVSRVTATRSAYQSSQVHPPEPMQQENVVKKQRGHIVPWILAILMLLGTAVISYFHFTEVIPEQPEIRMTVLPPDKSIVVTVNGGNLAISPDARLVAFVAQDSGGAWNLWIRPLHEEAPRILPGTDGATYPFWSPDNRTVGFFANGKLKKIDVVGGAPLTICTAKDGRGGTWNKDGIIVAALDQVTGLSAVPAAGGEPRVLTQIDTTRKENTHRWPCFLPDGKRFLYYSRSGSGATSSEADAIYVGSLDSTTKVMITHVNSNMVYAAGYVYFVRERTLMAQLFDPQLLELKDVPFALAEKIAYNGQINRAIFSVADNGTIAYQKGRSTFESTLTWFSRDGKILGTVGTPDLIANLRLSPDGTRIAIDLYDSKSNRQDIWIYDLQRNIKSRLTFDAGNNRIPVWSPDGKFIYFTSDRDVAWNIYRKKSDGTGGEELFFKSDKNKRALDWSMDAKYLLYSQKKGTGKDDVYIVAAGDSSRAEGIVVTNFDKDYPRFSPDGRWIAYQSDESGKYEIYVIPFRGNGGKRQISLNGGSWPVWRRDGKEIYYLTEDNRLMATQLKTSGASLEVGETQLLFKSSFFAFGMEVYDVTADGQKFVALMTESNNETSPVSIIMNWKRPDKAK